MIYIYIKTSAAYLDIAAKLPQQFDLFLIDRIIHFFDIQLKSYLLSI